ncbi:MAG: hypothetical protein CL745_02580, partial [Chloroflexi bacterium]|nr:hypothetical protein [Chloroflexota bacterium]
MPNIINIIFFILLFCLLYYYIFINRLKTKIFNGVVMPNRINRAIELLEDDQPIYYTGLHTFSKDFLT